tara:strand:- start:160 stop:450 length:291 start_codon:yes stop_codon:yes gene_type:complete
MNKYTVAQIITAWDAAYGEDISVEYPGFIQRLTEENPAPKWSYSKNEDGFMGSENRILEKEDKPEAGKTYALTGGPGERCIANGYSWKDSLVKEDK